MVATPLDPCRDGNCVIVVNRFGSALLAISSGLMVVVGVGALKPRVVMREAVTVTSTVLSSDWAFGGAAAGVTGADAGSGSCAVTL